MNEGGDPRLRWWIAINLAFCAAINYTDRAALASVLPPIRAEMHLSDIKMAALGSIFLWSYAILSPLAGYLADHTSRSRLIVLSVASWSLVSAASGLATSYQFLFCTRALLGACECFYLPSATALLASYHGTSTRGTAMALHSMGLNLGVVAGGTAAGWLADHFGWRAAFVAPGCVGLLIAAASAATLRDTKSDVPQGRDAGTTWQGILRLMQIPSYLAILAEVMLVALGVWTFFNWLPLYFRDTYGLSLASAGFAGTFPLQIATVIGLAGSGYWSDRLARKSKRNRMLLQGCSFLGAGPFLLVFLLHAGLVWAALGIFGFALLRGGGQANDNPVLCDVVPPHLRSTAIGIMNTCASLAGGLGVIATGVLKGRVGLSGCFALVSLAFVAAGLILLTTYKFRLGRDLERNPIGA